MSCDIEIEWVGMMSVCVWGAKWLNKERHSTQQENAQSGIKISTPFLVKWSKINLNEVGKEERTRIHTINGEGQPKSRSGEALCRKLPPSAIHFNIRDRTKVRRPRGGLEKVASFLFLGNVKSVRLWIQKRHSKPEMVTLWKLSAPWGFNEVMTQVSVIGARRGISLKR